MTRALAWLLLGGAVLLFPPGTASLATPPVRRPPLPVRAGPRRRLSRRTLQVLAGGLSGLVSVGSLGPGRGLFLAAAAIPAAAWVVGRLAARAGHPVPDASLALTLDLIVAALHAAQPVAAALLLAAPAAGPPIDADLARVGGLLRMGADPGEAWQVVAGRPVLAPVAAAAVRTSASGARLARAFGQLAAETRAAIRAAAQARAHRAGVFAMAPLGLCFLPAFVCLGIVPTAVGIIGGVLGSLP